MDSTSEQNKLDSTSRLNEWTRRCKNHVKRVEKAQPTQQTKRNRQKRRKDFEAREDESKTKKETIKNYS